MSKNNSNSVTFEILLKDYKFIKEENKLLRAERQNLFHENTTLKIFADASYKHIKRLFLVLFILLTGFFYQCYLYSSLKEENIKLKSQISSERSYK